MDPKRKKIYIILIVVCFGLSAVILGWSYFSAPSTVSIPTNTNIVTGNTGLTTPASPTNTAAGPQDFSTGYPAPNIFPATDVFDSSVLDSTAFKGLTDYTPLNTQGLLGRDNPYKNY